MLMARDRGCFDLAILLAIVDIQLGGCMNIFSSVFQEGQRLSFICTLQHKKEEAEGVIVFLCKDKSGDCSPEDSLEQLRLKRYSGTDGASQVSSQLVFTLDQVTPSDNGTYQCGASSRKTDIHLQGHFLSLLVTETGNYTVVRPKQTGHHELSHSKGTFNSGFRQEKLWVILVTSLMALKVSTIQCSPLKTCLGFLGRLFLLFPILQQGDQRLAPSPPSVSPLPL